MAVPLLTDLLKDRDSTVRSSAAYALGEFGPEARAAIPALMELLKDKDASRAAAASALGDIGPEASAATPAIIELLNDENEKVRRDADEALEKIRNETRNTSRPTGTMPGRRRWWPLNWRAA